jgi:hypothetical protein
MLAKRCVVGRQTLLKYVASALLPELLGDVVAGVDVYVSHVTARILVASDDEVPGVTRILMSMRVNEFHAFAPGITEDDERLTCLERSADFSGVFVRFGVSVHAIRGVAPDGTCMIMNGHSFVSLLFSSKRRD